MAYKRNKSAKSAEKAVSTSPAVRIIKKVFSVLGKTIGTVALVGIITGCIVLTVLSIYLIKLVNTEETIDLRNFKQNYTTIVYAEDPDTGEIYELQRLIGGENRIWVGIEKIPEHTRQAFIAIEDKRFDDQLGEAHGGVDWKRTTKATIDYFLRPNARRQGGSTITQQVIKNITGDDDVTITRKVQEIFRAINVEKEYSKDDILEVYLNTIALSNNTNGVQAASNLYFNKDVSELTIAESAAIASITQYPTKYDPFRNPENNKERRDYILFEMHEQQRITDAEYEEALKQSETMTFKREEAMQAANSTQSYFIDHMIEEILDDLVEQKGMTRGEAWQALYTNGYRVYATVNPKIQSIMEEKYLDDATFSSIRNEQPPQSGMVVTDTHGKILGIAGGRGQKVGDRMFNYATMAKRQPGSSIKPISVYGQAIEHNLITYSTIIEDSPLQEKNEEGEVISSWPKNHYAGFRGNMTVDKALQNSTNTIAVKICERLTPTRCFDFLTNKLGISTLVDARESGGMVFSDKGLSSMALGALTDGVTVLEMTGAYQIFANGGTFTEPYSYTKVLDSNGNVVLENSPEGNRVISEETAYIMNKLLGRVVSLGTGYGAGVQGAPVVGKTGTSDKDYNQWFVGATPKYVAGVWVGFERNKTVKYGSGGYPPVKIWHNVMQEIVKLDSDGGTFPVSSSVVERTYCTESGDIATTNCPSTALGYYKHDNVPGTCTLHISGSSTTDDNSWMFEDTDGDEDSSSDNWWE